MCSPGTSCVEDATHMQTCQAGSASGAGSATCTTCPQGTYASADGASACLTCQAGYKCPEGATEMQTCPKGTYSNFGAGSCTTCAPTTIAPEPSATSCDACDLYQVANDDRTACECQQGYYTKDVSSVALPAPPGVSHDTPRMTLKTLDLEQGYWRTTTSSTEIIPCPAVERAGGCGVPCLPRPRS